jgi:hypothetical protein
LPRANLVDAIAESKETIAEISKENAELKKRLGLL